MSIRIDDIDNELDLSKKYQDKDGKWYIKKPSIVPDFGCRMKDAIRVLRNTSFAVHYKEDEKEESKYCH